MARLFPTWFVTPVLLILAGVGAALGQAPWGLWPVALGGYALGLSLMTSSARPVLAGWLFGTAHFGLSLHWIVEPFLVDAAQTGALAPVGLIAMAGGMGVFWASAAGLGRRLEHGALGMAVALCLAELARAYVLTGFPWALPGHVFIASPALPAAACLGAHGLGLCLLLGLGLVLRWRAAPAVLGVALLATPFVLAALLPSAPPATGAAPTVRLVQPNAPQHLKWDPEWMGIFFRRGLEATAAEGTPDAVIWPETSLPQLLGRSGDVRPMVARASGGAPIVIGVQRYDEAGAPRNGLAVLTGHGGTVETIYDKHRLVPFGEYLPLPGVAEALGFGALAKQLAGRYAPGPGPRLIDVPGLGAVLPMICYEAIFPQDIRRVERPRAILHLTNDAWFGTYAGPAQHLALARLRAAESGLPLVRAANTGISAAINGRGEVLATLGLGRAGHLDVTLPPALPETVYVKTGDWVVGATLVLLLIGLSVLGRRKTVDVTPDRA
ncbi:apolipoprotein N-acyltransferase [Jannaschia pagri]|uniref:Apolipoprotein N-acyltransferase n=1 Tax=Jannaschia pagri TaxID=2829797 RepID=A0ABQ4NHQ1_9RHOB|nr:MULTISPECIES: apolipoprotein N-acyltransferase [unclassified Jannaschia]GIT89954.1 apolipoprotein N-acyltransferase [Jannaschia sp. AI_61]GIT93939.1 apolipoprotein N-acyltransferase [Jannaschia sp. AI_62]